MHVNIFLDTIKLYIYTLTMQWTKVTHTILRIYLPNEWFNLLNQYTVCNVYSLCF